MIARLACPLLLLGLLSGGCSKLFIPNIGDLSLQGLDIVDMHDRPEIGRPPDAPRPSPALLIRFSTKADLVRFSRRHAVTVWPQASLCQTPGIDLRSLLTKYNGVHDSRHEIVPWDFRARSDPPDLAGRHSYHAFILTELSRRYEFEQLGEVHIAYDLRQEAADICFAIRGGNMIGGYYTSNVIVIPAAAIRAALDHAAP